MEGDGGEGGIRTHGTLARTPVFKTGAFDHSATSPQCVADRPFAAICWQMQAFATKRALTVEKR